MDNEIKKLLQDLLICIETIETYIGEKKVFANYESPLVSNILIMLHKN